MTNKHIHQVVEVIRDESNIATSVNITLNLHNATKQMINDNTIGIGELK